MSDDLTERPSTTPRTAAIRSPANRPTLRRPRRRPVKRSIIWLHRWLSLVVGLFLVVETTTGAVLLYDSELQRHLHRDSYVRTDQAGGDLSTTNPVSYQQAIDAVKTTAPDFTPGYVYDDAATILVSDSTTGDVKTVDPRSGAVIGGWVSGERPPGALAYTLALFRNIHLCALTCEEDPLYVAWLVKEVPHSQWLGFEDDGVTSKITWGGLVLGVLAVLLVFLALSGIWLWWPTFRHFKRGVRIRRGNRYARDYDLHQVAGMIVVPLLLMWGLTGVSYELGFFEKGWYAALPGKKIEAPTLTSTGQGPEIGYDQAVVAAQQAAQTTDRPVYYEVPAADDKTAPYSIWFSDGFDPWAGAGSSGGDLQVLVDRHDADRTAIGYGNPEESVAQHLYQDYNYPLHAGIAVNGWIRIIWLVAGLVPLLLAWTGVSTWLFKRSVRKRRRRAEQRREAERAQAVLPVEPSDAVGSPDSPSVTDTDPRELVGSTGGSGDGRPTSPGESSP